MTGKTYFFAIALMLLGGCSSSLREGGVPLPVAVGSSSAAPRAAIQTELSDGPGIAALINQNYNEDTTSCTEYGTGITRGYYFCTGVLLRSVDNGGFKPWEPSPTALQLRATSYSWIRHDLRNDTFYRRAGYILLSPADVKAGAVPGMAYLATRPGGSSHTNPAVVCVYPLDAWTTRTMNRNYLGCDFEGTGLGHPNIGVPWGSCDDRLGLTSASQWNDNFRAYGQINYNQCSWNIDNEQGWRNMISSHNTFAGGTQSAWNEVMMFNWGPNGSPGVNDIMRRWTVAFFYDVAKAGSLPDAQEFQRKMSATNKRVPILRIDFSAAPSQRFQFLAGDQVAGAYP